MSSSDWEASTARDWAGIESRLAEWLGDVPEGDTVILETPTPYDDLDGASPYVQITVEDDGLVRGEVSSNNYLDERLALNDARISQLEAMGWCAPTCGVEEDPDTGSTNFYADLDLPSDADLLAAMLVMALRDVFGVPHPSFVTVAGFGPAGRLDAEEMPFGLTVSAPDAAEAETTTAGPESADELRDLVETALADVVEHELTYDSDGDIPIYADGAVIFVRVEEDSPSIRVFAPLLSNLRWTPRVGSKLSDLNLRARYAKVIFSDGVLFATVQLYGSPFVAAHLCQAVEDIRALVTDVADDLLETLGGERFVTGASSDSTDEEAE